MVLAPPFPPALRNPRLSRYPKQFPSKYLEMTPIGYLNLPWDPLQPDKHMSDSRTGPSRLRIFSVPKFWLKYAVFVQSGTSLPIFPTSWSNFQNGCSPFLGGTGRGPVLPSVYKVEQSTICNDPPFIPLLLLYIHVPSTEFQDCPLIPEEDRESVSRAWG
jgi:hypothetical protein